MSNIIDQLEKKAMKESLPSYSVGDTVVVSQQIVEGKKSRIQKFEGTVIKTQGSLSRESITVRKVIDSIGVEKTFLLHSSMVDNVNIKQRSRVRRSKLYYLRDRLGSKATRLKVKD